MRILNLILITLFSSCYWREFKISEPFSDNLRKTKLNKNYKDAIEREKSGNYSFGDFTKFKKELEELSKWKIAALLEKESEIKKAKETANEIYEQLSWDMVNGTCHTTDNIDGLEKDAYFWVDKFFNENKAALQELEKLHKRENVTFEDFSMKIYSSINLEEKPLPYVFYISSCRVIYFKNKNKDYIKNVNIKDLKVNLAKGTRILIYHFPYLFEKLKFLFEREEVFDK